ncbi:MAG: RNA polymerase sigma factor [Longimicrobiales bacterium]
MTAVDDRTGGAAENAPDGALIRAALRGDDEAFARLVRRYLRKAMAVSMEYARTREDAEDVVQETFRRVLEGLGRFDLERSFEPWFFTILRNTARNASKSRRLRDHEALTAEVASSTPGPFEEMQQSELRQRIGEALDRLPAMQRTCFRLCMVEGFSSAEAADAVGLAESTVRVHVFRARQALQGLLRVWRNEVEEA